MAGQEAEIGALGAMIIAGLFGRVFLKRSGLSDVLMLLVFGAAVGAVLPQQTLAGLDFLLLPLGAVALLMIILDEGMRLPFESLKKQAHKAVIFSLLSFSTAFLTIFLVSHYVAGFEIGVSLLVAAIFSSVAPELLSGFLGALSAPEPVKGIGEIEATLSDAFSVIATLLIASSLAHDGGAIPLSDIPLSLLLTLALSSACGSLFAAGWRLAMKHLAEDNEHLFAIGLAAILYSVSGLIGANGVVSVFVFGFFLGNISHKSVEGMQRFQAEITFFLRTFFFTYLGILLFHSEKSIEAGAFALAISLLLALARRLSGKAMALIEPEAAKCRLLELVSCRGLTPAVLAVVVSAEQAHAGNPLPINLPLLAMFVIFFTNLISAALVFRGRGRLLSAR